MIHKLLIVLPTVSVIFVSGSAFAQNAGDCRNMLTASVGMSLDIEGFDTSNACDLSVADLAVIKSLLTEEGMGTRRQVQLILDRAG
jgi:hypothetical protein